MSWRTKLAVVAAFVGAGIALPASPAVAATFNPVADSYVDSSTPTTNYGTRAYFRTDGSPVLRSYLRFNVSGFTAGTSVTLRVFAETGSSGGIQVRSVADNTWGETSITYNNAPPVGQTAIASTGPFSAGAWLSLNVSSAVTADGPVSFALITTSSTAIRLTSREGVNKPELVLGAASAPAAYEVSRIGTTSSYQARSSANGQTFTGTLKFVVETAVADLESAGGGTVNFTAGTFDFGAEYFKFSDIYNIDFAGAGMNATIIQNVNSSAADTEPFNFSGADRVKVRDLTVSAGGAFRSTSDALDFDQGNNVLIENVKVTASRGRGIVFDGKNSNWTSVNNTVRNCVISGAPSDGIELLASSNNRIEGCTITNVGGHGIQAVKSSPSADQPNKKSSDNVIIGNTIDQAGQDGINVTSGDRNQVLNNMVTNSSDDTSGRDGIRINSSDSITCNDNTVSGNTATDNQATKTQRYGLNISSSLCNRTVVGPGNNFAGNLTGPINNAGTNTIFKTG